MFKLVSLELTNHLESFSILRTHFFLLIFDLDQLVFKWGNIQKLGVEFEIWKKFYDSGLF